MCYTVREVAEKLNMPAFTIRYYDKRGLLPSLARSSCGARTFTERDIAHLKEILILRAAGVSLKELTDYVDAEREGPQAVSIRLHILDRRCEAIELEIIRLRDSLAQLQQRRHMLAMDAPITSYHVDDRT